MQRRRFKHPDSLAARLYARAAALRELALESSSTDQRGDLLQKAEQCDAAAAMDGWLRSKELEPPKRG